MNPGMKSKQIQKGDFTDEALQRKGNLVPTGGNIKPLLTEASKPFRPATRGQTKSRWQIVLLIYFHVSAASLRVENPVFFSPPSCQQKSATGPFCQLDLLSIMLCLSLQPPFHTNAPYVYLYCFFFYLSFCQKLSSTFSQ